MRDGTVSDHDLRAIITCNITVIRNVINKITDSYHGCIFWMEGGSGEAGRLVDGKGCENIHPCRNTG